MTPSAPRHPPARIFEHALDLARERTGARVEVRQSARSGSGGRAVRTSSVAPSKNSPSTRRTKSTSSGSIRNLPTHARYRRNLP